MDKKNRLSDSKLEKISGGFIADRGYTKGMNIFCRECGNEDMTEFEFDTVATQEGDYYHCLKCGNKFYMFPDGTIEGEI